MCDFIYAVAQINSLRNNPEANIQKHLDYIKLAAQQNADIIMFPEMSITGYERALAREQCFTIEDERLVCFQKASDQYQISIVVGAPLLLEERLYISSFIFQPFEKRQIYIKKYLHPGEETVFHPGLPLDSAMTEFDPSVLLKNKQISFAICYDIERKEHIECVHNRKSHAYLASIFYSKEGIPSGLERLQYIAKEYAITVAMSNYVGECYDLQAGGCSAIWSDNGDLVVSADTYSECLLTAQKSNGTWVGEVVRLRKKAPFW